jgi:hypothetical protein
MSFVPIQAGERGTMYCGMSVVGMGEPSSIGPRRTRFCSFPAYRRLPLDYNRCLLPQSSPGFGPEPGLEQSPPIQHRGHLHNRRYLYWSHLVAGPDLLRWTRSHCHCVHLSRDPRKVDCPGDHVTVMSFACPGHSMHRCQQILLEPRWRHLDMKTPRFRSLVRVQYHSDPPRRD